MAVVKRQEDQFTTRTYMSSEEAESVQSYQNVKKGYDGYRRPAFFVSKPDALISDKTSGVADKPYPAYFYQRL